MRKLLVSVGALMVVCGFAMANFIQWTNDGLPPDYVYNQSGALITDAMGFTIELWKDDGDSTIEAYGTGDSLVTGSATALDATTVAAPGVFFVYADLAGFGVLNNEMCYTRIWNAAHDWYVNVGNPATLTAAYVDMGGTALDWNYATGGTAGGTPGGWQQAVPEPTSMALFGIGALVLGYRKLRKS